MAELPGILAWAVAGCLEWQGRTEDRLGFARKVWLTTGDYRAEMDPITPFVKDCCVCRPEIETTTAELYEAFRGWARAAGEHEPFSPSLRRS